MTSNIDRTGMAGGPVHARTGTDTPTPPARHGGLLPSHPHHQLAPSSEGLRRQNSGSGTMAPRGSLPPPARGPLASRDVIIQIDASPSHQPPPLSPPRPEPEAPDVGHPRPSGTHPGFFEALGARMQGAAPVLAGQSAIDMVFAALEAAAMGASVGASATQALVQAGLRFGIDGALNLGITAATQTPALANCFMSENQTKEDALNRMRGVSAMLSMAGGAAVSSGLTKAAAALLHQPLSGTGIALAIVNNLVATGVLTAGARALYQTNPEFRKQMDVHLESVWAMFRNRSQPPLQSEDPPSFAQADAMELGQVAPIEPQRRG